MSEKPPLPPNASSSSSGRTSASTSGGSDGSAAHRNGSRRKEQNAAQLRGAMTRVSEQLISAAVPTQMGGMPLSPAPMGRKNVSLKLPRLPPDQPQQESGGMMENGIPEQTEQDELEELRLQNAVLRKSLAMLQKSVVDSMKGNKQFMGGGIFKGKGLERSASNGPGTFGPPLPVPPAAGGTGGALDADIEGLRNALAERRAALRTALEERDQAIAERDAALGAAAAARKEIEALTARQHAMEAQLLSARQQLQATEAKLQLSDKASQEAKQSSRDLSVLCESLKAQVNEAHQGEVAARQQCAALQAQLEALKGDHSSTEAELRAAIAEQTRLAQKAEVEKQEMQKRLLTLEAEMSRLLASVEEDRRLRQMRLAGSKAHAHRALSRIAASWWTAVDGEGVDIQAAAWLRPCFMAWKAALDNAREEQLQEKSLQLQREVERLTADLEAHGHSASQGQSDFAAQAERLQQTLEALALTKQEMAALQAKLDQAQRDAQKAHDHKHAATGQEAALREELEAAQAALLTAQKAEQDAVEAREEAKRFSSQLEEQKESLSSELKATKKSLQNALKEAEEAKKGIAELNKRVQTLQAQAAEFQAQLAQARQKTEAAEAKAAQAQEAGTSREEKLRAAELAEESQRRAIEERTRELQEAREAASAAANATAQASAKADAAASERDAALTKAQDLSQQLTEVKQQLAAAKSDAQAAADQLRVLKQETDALTSSFEAERVEHQRALELQKVEMEKAAAFFTQEARQALQEAKQNIRIMVTAPKVSINIGGNGMDVHAPFPFAAIKESVQREVIPKYSRIVAVGERVGDAELRQEVQSMVEQLALTLQQRVYELMPQAEGTCNWDGFGAKVGGLK